MQTSLSSLSFGQDSLLAGDLNVKHPLWSSVVFNLSGAKLLNLMHVNAVEISVPQCAIHYSPAGNGDVLDIFVHKNVRLSEVIVFDILNSDYLPVVFTPRKITCNQLCLWSRAQGQVRLERLGQLKKFNDIGNRTRYLPTCSIKPTMLLCAHDCKIYQAKGKYIRYVK
jgi:hypothetical protein